ncbi:hypothetical protein BDM02DRAFT_3112112 [Thelephora ganbajun]|uniref:Uncharacterized protein n=1 Tax=Thelephora ganbajun TaxID=370292 RepID=A0ACB6ZL66_THEGA|nr:hypothetical protein BDM02DRAFT_3112112 [Thelephora ganbajun]
MAQDSNTPDRLMERSSSNPPRSISRPARPNVLVVPDPLVQLTSPLSPANNLQANTTAHVTPPRSQIPQRLYAPVRIQRDFCPAEPVLFSMNGVPGISVAQAIAEDYTGLDGRDEGISSFGSSKATCRIQFTGYDPYASKVNTRHHDVDWTPITRCKLAKEVGKRVEEYIEGQGLQGTLALEKIYFTRLIHLSKGSWQPELWCEDLVNISELDG